MKRILSIFAILALSVGLIGCNKSSSPEPGKTPDGGTTAPADAQGSAAQPKIEFVAVPGSDDPAGAVLTFLRANKDGDQPLVEQMLTVKARSEAAERSVRIDSFGSINANYDVGEVVYVGDSQDGAHVQSQWSELTPDGEAATYEVVWILRKESTQWRIAGAAIQQFENSEPLVLNFEDPDETLRQVKAANERYLAQQEQQAQAAAQQPVQPVQPETLPATLPADQQDPRQATVPPPTAPTAPGYR